MKMIKNISSDTAISSFAVPVLVPNSPIGGVLRLGTDFVQIDGPRSMCVEPVHSARISADRMFRHEPAN